MISQAANHDVYGTNADHDPLGFAQEFGMEIPLGNDGGVGFAGFC